MQTVLGALRIVLSLAQGVGGLSTDGGWVDGND
jgi:hypothetical protein